MRKKRLQVRILPGVYIMHKPLSKTQIRRLNERIAANYSPVDLAFILQDVEDPINVGAFFRLADALNAELVLTGNTPKPPIGGISATARGLERSVPWTYISEFADSVTTVRDLGYQIVGVELTPDAQPFDRFDYQDKVALVMGNEASGIHKKNIELLDAVVAMPMLGKGPSLNVQVAGAVAGYQVISHNSGTK